jgi:hypothetical protein
MKSSNLFKNMKIIRCSIVLFSFIVLIPNLFGQINDDYTGETINFIGSKVTFGCTVEQYRNIFIDAKLFEGENEFPEVKLYIYDVETEDPDIKIIISAKFYKSKLFNITMRTDGVETEMETGIVTELLEQFKKVPNTHNSEIGDVFEIYELGGLEASEFVGGFYQIELTDKNILKQIKNIYKDY